MEVTCSELWRDWMLKEPSNPLVIQAKIKMAEYSKDDWVIMSQEATDMVKSLGYLVENNIPVDSELAKKGFDDLMEHLSKWFFTLNLFHVLRFKALTEYDPKYVTYFNQFHPGLAAYMPGLLLEYYKEV
jgi:hypothetical protein